MSIKVGFLNENYNINNIIDLDNSLVLNSYRSSNLILLNTDIGTTDDVIINYKNKITTGYKNSKYGIIDIENNCNIAQFSKNNIILEPPLDIKNRTNIYDIVNITNNGTTFNSNISLYFKSQSNIFNIKNKNNQDLLLLSELDGAHININSNNFTINSNNHNIISINSNITNINNNVKINYGKLYVDEILPNTGSTLTITNISYQNSLVESIIVNSNISITNLTNTTDNKVSLKIYKNKDENDIVEIVTKDNNINNKVLTVNGNGNMYLGNTDNNSVLHISKVQDNIFSYKGTSNGDIFILKEHGDIGIGTTVPQGQLHIRRNDDLTNMQIRKTPLLNLDMNYNASCNINTIITPYSTSISGRSPDLPTVELKRTAETIEGVQTVLKNAFYIFNTEIMNVIQNNITNINNISFIEQSLTFTNSDNQLYSDTDYNINVKISEDKLIFINSPLYNITELGTFDRSSTDINNVKTFIHNRKFIIHSTVYNQVYTEESNAILNNFKLFTYEKVVYTKQYLTKTSIIKYFITLIVEDNIQDTINVGNIISINYLLNYNTVVKEIINPSNIYIITSNQSFISSLSPYGTLSLGKEVPYINKNDYLLYASGTCYTSNLKVDKIIPIGDSISYNNNNINNINKIIATSNIITHSFNTNSYINNIYNSNLTVYNNINTNTLTFNTLNSDYIEGDNCNIHITSRLTLGKDKTINELNNNTVIRSIVDSSIIEKHTQLSNNTTFQRKNGMIITNATTEDPCLSIQSINNTIPYIALENSNSSYFLRIKKDKYNNASDVNIFELCCDNIIYTNGNVTKDRSLNYNNSNCPHIIQHIKDYNVMTIGENNVICIDCEDKKKINNVNYNYNNKDNKISIGIPYKKITQNPININYSDYPKYFNDSINTTDNPYMLNIFGNVKIANIYNSNLFTIQYNETDNNIYMGINSEPDMTNTLVINGSVKINTNDINMTLIDNSNVTYTSLLTYIKSLENKIDTLSGDLLTTSNLISNRITSYHP